MHTTYKDPAKQKAREKFLDFIKKYNIKKPEETKVVCFPGAEALEVFEVYDKLGISRENITGLERDNDAFAQIQKQNLGIRLENKVDEEFFRENNETFDVISLDYCGNLTLRVHDTVGVISAKHRLTNNGILMTNLLGARETAQMSREMRMCSVVKNELSDYIRTKVPGDITEDTVDLANFLSKRVREIEFTEESRDCGITQELISLLRAGFTHQGHHPLLRCNKTYDKIMQRIDEKYQTFLADERGVDADKQDLKRMYGRFKEGKFAGQGAYAVHFAELVKEFEALDLGSMLACALTFWCSDGYEVERIERYKYVSNSRSPMATDLLTVRLMRDVIDFKPYEVSVEITPERQRRIVIAGHEIMKPVHLFHSLVQKDIRRVEKRCSKLIQKLGVSLTGNLPRREHLGSGYVPKESIGESDACDLLKSGCTPEEIVNCYSGISKKRLYDLKKN